MAGFVDEGDERRDLAGGPVPRHQFGPRRVAVARGADQRDDRIDIGDRHREAGEDVGALAGPGQQEARAAENDLLAEPQEGPEYLLQTELFGAAVAQGERVDAEIRLQRGVAVELAQHDIVARVALEFDDDAHAVAVRLVAQGGDPLDALVAHRIGDLFDQPRLVDLIGDLDDDDHPVVLFGDDPPAHGYGAPAGAVGGADAGPADDQPAGGKIRPRDVRHQVFDRQVRVVEERKAGGDDLAQIMGRDIGGHADGDAAGAVHEQVGEARRQDRRLAGGLVVVRLEVDGVLVEVFQEFGRDPRKARLGVAHGGGLVAVHGAVVPLTVDQRQAHGEGLRHAHHGVVDRLAAVGVVVAHHVADDMRGFPVRAVPLVAVVAHRIEDAAVHRLEAVAHVGQRARHDHAHGVIEIRTPHLLLDGDRRHVGRRGRRRRFGSQGELGLVAQSRGLFTARSRGGYGRRAQKFGGAPRPTGTRAS